MLLVGYYYILLVVDMLSLLEPSKTDAVSVTNLASASSRHARLLNWPCMLVAKIHPKGITSDGTCSKAMITDNDTEHFKELIRSLKSWGQDGNNADDADGENRCSQELEHFTERTRLARSTMFVSGTIVTMMLVSTMIGLIVMGARVVLRTTECSPGKIECSSSPTTNSWGDDGDNKQPRYTQPLDHLVQGGNKVVGDISGILDFAIIR